MLKGGGVKFESKSFEELFEGLFQLEFGHFQGNGGGGSQIKKKLEELFQFRVGHFPRKGGVADPNPNFLRNFRLLEKRPEQKLPRTGYKDTKGGGSRRFRKNPK